MKLSFPNAALLCVALQLGSLGAAQAQVTFEDVAPTGYTDSPITSQQFTFTTAGIHRVGNAATLAESVLEGDGNFLVYNSTIGFGESFAFATSAPFNLLSLDLGGWYNFGPGSQTVTVNGVRADNSIVSTNLSVVAGSFSHFALSGFSNLTSVNLVHAGGETSYYVGIDNIVTTPVPEPTSLAMLLGGLVLLAYRRPYLQRTR